MEGLNLFDEINAHRSKLKLAELMRSYKLERLAIKRAEQERDEGDALDHQEIPVPIGILFMRYGEILARGFGQSKELISAWIKSESHRRQIEYPDYRFVGVGIVGDYVCIIFGEPIWITIINKIRRLLCR